MEEQECHVGGVYAGKCVGVWLGSRCVWVREPEVCGCTSGDQVCMGVSGGQMCGSQVCVLGSDVCVSVCVPQGARSVGVCIRGPGMCGWCVLGPDVCSCVSRGQVCVLGPGMYVDVSEGTRV